jgi:Uma2 family endonuclease
MAPTTKQWTLEELHSLPDDGNKYELISGELFVTPPPNADHETTLARLARLLEPYVAAQGLGYLYHPRSVLRVGGSEVEPDLMVRQPPPRRGIEWSDMPRPILIVEVLSPSTSRRDRLQKRAFYLAQSIPEYWIVDPEHEVVTVVRPGQDDRTVDDAILWHPAGARAALTLPATEVFGRGGAGP